MLFFTGILCITVGYINQIKKCPPPQVEYRYIPRTFKQEQDNPVPISLLFRNMFEEPSTWVAGTKIYGKANANSNINRYFISQD